MLTRQILNYGCRWELNPQHSLTFGYKFMTPAIDQTCHARNVSIFENQIGTFILRKLLTICNVHRSSLRQNLNKHLNLVFKI